MARRPNTRLDPTAFGRLRLEVAALKNMADNIAERWLPEYGTASIALEESITALARLSRTFSAIQSFLKEKELRAEHETV